MVVVDRSGLRQFGRPAYLSIFRRNSTWIGFIVAGAFIADSFTDGVVNSFWNANNRGVCSSSARTHTCLASHPEPSTDTNVDLCLSQIQWPDLKAELEARKNAEE
jgi:hypothetical protein